jgi:D-glycero-beta-D-manno-heptose-7-phosphate kinase
MITRERFNNIINSFEKIPSVLVVGDVGVDKYTYGEVNRISPEAPVPVLEVSREWTKLGLAANVSDNLKSLKVDSTICGVIGDDVRGSLLESLLEENNLKIWGIVRDTNRKTTYKERMTTNSQQICRVDYETLGPVDPITKTKILNRVKELSINSSCLIIEDYGKGLLSEDLSQAMITHFKSQNKMVAVDPSRSTPPLWYRGANLLKPNYLESKMMAQALGYTETNVEKLAKLLVDKLSLEKIIITLGAEGMAFIDTLGDGQLHRIPTVANEVFDVSGAGDTAISAITACLAAGASLEEAAWIGNCAAGVVVGKKGTALVNQQELFEFFERLEKKKL